MVCLSAAIESSDIRNNGWDSAGSPSRLWPPGPPLDKDCSLVRLSTLHRGKCWTGGDEMPSPNRVRRKEAGCQ
jgi:hypothetical protein